VFSRRHPDFSSVPRQNKETSHNLDLVELIVRQFNQVFTTGPRRRSASASDKFYAGMFMTTTNCRTADVEELKVFYREAGRADAPMVLLLRGFPSAGHMFRALMTVG